MGHIDFRLPATTTSLVRSTTQWLIRKEGEMRLSYLLVCVAVIAIAIPAGEAVNCGRHTAMSCSRCPFNPASGTNNGKHWCNGDCFWDANGRCVSKALKTNCGRHHAASCAACPFDEATGRDKGKGWCNGDCKWDGGMCL